MIPTVASVAWWQSHRSEAVLAYVLRAGGGASRGGVEVDLERWLSGPPSASDGRHPLPSPADFAAGMSCLGIGDGDTVVAYDDASGVFAARLVWMLRVLGVTAALLDSVPPVTPVVSRPAAGFAARPWPASALASVADVLDPSQVVVDARPRERFHGAPDPLDPRPGHVPGARSLPCRESLGADGSLLPDAELRARFAAAGVVEGAPVVAYCGSGVTGCHDLLVMEHLGLGSGRARSRRRCARGSRRWRTALAGEGSSPPFGPLTEARRWARCPSRQERTAICGWQMLLDSRHFRHAQRLSPHRLRRKIEHVFEISAAPGSGGLLSAVELSLPVKQLLSAVEQVVAQVPAGLPGPQALADTAALLGAIEQLHGAALGRVADVDARKLHTLDGAASTTAWVAQQQTSLDRGEVALARRLGSFPLLNAAVRERRLSIAVAERVGKALVKLRRHVDRHDGLIDGQPAEQVLVGVIGHGVKDLICQHLAGLADDDPRLSALLDELAAIVESSASELGRLEAAFVLLAQHLESHALPDALGTLVDACLPNELEKRAADAHSNRGFGLRLNADGSGWRVTDGDLDLECGELLHTVLQAQLEADPDSPTDTAGYEQLRADGWQAGDPLPADHGQPTGPRSLRQKRHDALKNGLRRLLDSGALGLRGKAAPHLSVTLGLDTLHGAPGALPAVAASGARLPASLVRSWWCDSAATRFILSLGRRVLETSHTERTLKAHERRIKKIETGNTCQIAGCRCGPGRRLIPHHPDAFARTGTTSLTDTVWTCDSDHHHIHTGHTLRLKDGRWINEHGWTDGPGG